MYTSHIGKRFVQLYNEREKKALSAEEFFDKEFFSLFYDHARYLQSPANTPLFQLVADHLTHDAEARQAAKKRLENKIMQFIQSNSAPEMSFALGYPAADIMKPTSSQVTSLQLPLNADDMYSSWIGAGFGIGIAGKLTLVFDKPEILSALHEGWRMYREYVNQTDNIANKIDAWNGKWLSHRFDEYFNPLVPRAGFSPITIATKGKDKGKNIIERPNWTTVLMILSATFPNDTLVSYVYSFGKTNNTIGFVKILPGIHRLSDFWTKLFGYTSPEQRRRLIELYKTQFTFEEAVELFGAIGLRAFEPKDLRIFGKPNFSDDLAFKTNFKIYKTWICAMLNNEELIKKSEEFAQRLFRFYNESEYKTQNQRGQMIRDTLAAHGRISLLECLGNLSVADSMYAGYCKELTDEITRVLPRDETYYFVLLTKINYYAIKANISQQ